MMEYWCGNVKDWAEAIIEAYLQHGALIKADNPKDLMLGFEINNEYYYLGLIKFETTVHASIEVYKLLINLWARTNGLNTGDYSKSDYYKIISMSDEEFEKQLRVFELISIVEK